MRNPVSHFAYSQADAAIRRSAFDRNHDHKTTMSAGLLYPILVDEVLPGDTYSVDMASLIRMSTPIHPVMDNAYLDTYFFFVPNRIVWDHWKNFMGEPNDNPYAAQVEYSVPVLNTGGVQDDANFNGIPPKSILDYMGVPANTVPKEINALPIRAFCKIWNEWFRDQNLQRAIAVPTNDTNYAYATPFFGFWDNNNRTNDDAYVTNAFHGGDLPPVNKYHDYFTSALREPQKGQPVAIPINGFAPVYANDDYSIHSLIGTQNVDAPKFVTETGAKPSSGALGTAYADGSLVGNSTAVLNALPRYIDNFVADLSRVGGVYATINDLRYAFQLQKFMEADNRGGTRYREILKQHFNVTSPDASMQVPEFLGGKRVPINMSQVLQTSASNDVTPQGNTAAYSLTTDKYSAFTKSFTEHGYLIGVACIRTEHTYAQGIEKMWSKKSKFDFYFPEFASISEQPIYNREIFNGNFTNISWQKADEIFGYQEAWAEYRYKPNRVSAEFSPTYPQSLDIWHYADHYESTPVLSSGWIRETRSNIDRTLAVNDPDSDQFICDFYFKMKTVRPMPVYSIPGLADHY